MKEKRLIASLIAAAFALALIVLLVPRTTEAQPSSVEIFCNTAALYDAATSGNTLMVASGTETETFVCGYTLRSGASAVNVRLVTGTGSACATDEASLTPLYTLTTYDGAVDGATTYRGMKVPEGSDLCIETSGAVGVDAVVYYSQR